MALIGLDIGTTGCKSTIFSVEGSVCSCAYKEYRIEHPGPGLYELNPEVVWNAVMYVIATSVRQYQGEGITALCVSSFGEAAVPIDDKDRVLHNSLLYTDMRGSEQIDNLKKKLSVEEIMERTGLHIHSMYTLGKIMWIKENKKEIYNNTWKFMLYEDFILYKLGGIPAIDYSLASRTMAFNVSQHQWDQKILDLTDIKEDIFSPAVASGTVVSTLQKNIAFELGLPNHVQLVTGGHDQVCAAVGSGVIYDGLAVDGIGTVECIAPAFNRPILNEKMLRFHFACVPHAKKDLYMTYAFHFSGGALLKWYRDQFMVLETTEAQSKGLNIYSILDSQAPREPTDILVLPHFAGSGTPYMDIASRGAIIGLRLDTSASEIYRGILEGITYEMLFNMECLESAGILIQELRAVGGGAKSDFWLQIKADIMNRKITSLQVDEAGTLGTAILAGTATGIYSSMEEAVKTLVKVKKEFYPNKRNHEIYLHQYSRYKKIYQAMKDIDAV